MILIKTDWNWRLLVFAGYLLTFVIADYKVGIGISDVTGPVVEVTFVSSSLAFIIRNKTKVMLRK